ETRPVDNFARCPAQRYGAVIQVGARSVRDKAARGGGFTFAGRAQVKQTGGAVPHGAALCAPATKSPPPPTRHGRGCRTSRPRPWCGVGVMATCNHGRDRFTNRGLGSGAGKPISPTGTGYVSGAGLAVRSCTTRFI